MKRSILGNVGFMFEGLADTIGNITGMTSKFAEAGEELGEAALVMSKSNTKLITLKTAGEEQAALKELEEKYGSELFDIID